MFIKSWMPKEGRAKGIIFLCHGYGDTVTFFFEGQYSSMYHGSGILELLIFALYLLHINLEITDPVSVP